MWATSTIQWLQIRVLDRIHYYSGLHALKSSHTRGVPLLIALFNGVLLYASLREQSILSSLSS